jgi:hypothetical protein
MLRPIDAPPLNDPATRRATLTVRAEPGAGERASAGTMEQASIAVGQAAVVALGNGARPAGDGDAHVATVTYTRPPPSTADAPQANSTSDAKATEQSDSSGLDSSLAYAVGAHYKIVRGADGLEYAVRGQVMVNQGSIHDDPEAAIRELTQIREAALTPPTSATDLQLAARAAMDVQRAQLELARRRYVDEASADAQSRAPTSIQPKTDVKA